ncbi:hypothetical protein GIB67_018521 [Kingdonia uniflora]|uniref:Uncharacterized protein n=1 Tax=Kingdonia uniflora TaxID=39325 RepID=A0A7J7LWD8_9MAGN|nr:hypothetical protein GIB67_018521 [Kingdonia uniflora]
MPAWVELEQRVGAIEESLWKLKTKGGNEKRRLVGWEAQLAPTSFGGDVGSYTTGLIHNQRNTRRAESPRLGRITRVPFGYSGVGMGAGNVIIVTVTVVGFEASSSDDLWEEKVRRITPEDVLQFYGVKNFKASGGGSYFCASVTRRRFFNLNSVGQTWNDNIIWLKGNCLQRDDEEPLDLQFITEKQSMKSTVEWKESLLDEVAKEETELELVSKGLGLSRKKRVDSMLNKARKAKSTRSMAGVDEGKRQVCGEEVQTNLSKTPGTGSSAQANPFKSSNVAQKYLKKWVLQALPASGITGSGDVAKDKRMRVEPSGESGEKVTEGQSASVGDLKEVEERVWLAVLQGEEDTSKMVARLVKGIWIGIEEEKNELKKVNVELEKELARSRANALKEVRQLKASHAVAIGDGYIKANTYIEEEDEDEAEAVGIVDGLDGISCQTVLDNQVDDVEFPEGGSEKAVRQMSLKINDLKYGLARERDTSKALLSAQAELQVELDSSHSREDNDLMCNREFAEQFDRMKEASENKEDQYADTAQYHIQALEQSEERFRSDLQKCRNELEQMRQKFVKKDDELRVARENLSASEAAAEHLQTALPAKDMEF